MSKVFAINLLIAVAVLAGLYLYLNTYIEGVTQHGEKVVVPSVMKKPVAELDELLIEEGFRYEIMDSIWKRNMPKGIVLDQQPTPGDSVKEGRKIYLTINARSDKMVKLALDNMIGGTSHAREAIDYLISNDLVHGEMIDVPYEYEGIVLGFVDSKGKTLKDGDEVKAGSVISIKVGHVKGEDIRTPKVKGMSLQEAIVVLKGKLLNVTTMEKEDHACVDGLDSSSAIVYMQRPECGEDIKVGKEVSLFYTCDSTYKFSKECK